MIEASIEFNGRPLILVGCWYGIEGTRIGIHYTIVPFRLYDMFNTEGTEKHLEFFIEENYGAKTGNFSEFGFYFLFGLE